MSWSAILVIGITSHMMASGITDKDSCMRWAREAARDSVMIGIVENEILPIKPGYGLAIICVPNFHYPQ